MKNLKVLIGFIFVIVLDAYCKKNVVEYDKNHVTSNKAEFQLHYFVQITTGEVNNIYKVEVNGKVVFD